SNGVQCYWQRFVEVSYPRQIAAIKCAYTVLNELAAKHRGVGALQRPSVILDATGVGLPVYETLLNEGVPVLPYTFTNPSKLELLGKLAAAFDNGQIRLMDHEEQERELVAFEQSRTAAGNYQMGAPSGMHDDCVISLALAWYGVSGGGYYSRGVY